MSLIVITDNGNMPNHPTNPGKRIGYQAGDTLVILSPYTVYSISALAAEEARQRRMNALDYDSLPIMQFGECTRCRSWRVKSEPTETNRGYKYLVRCIECETLMSNPGY